MVVKSTFADPRAPLAESESVELALDVGVATMVMLDGFREESSEMAPSKLEARMIVFKAIESRENGISSLLTGL